MCETPGGGVPVYGIIDTGGDITIINGTLLKKVVTVARFKELRNSRQSLRGYDGRPFVLHGCTEMDGIGAPFVLHGCTNPYSLKVFAGS